MSERLFHPAVEAWFAERFGQATRPQAKGWPAIGSGRHTLIAAPTGSGKTLAAFLAVLNDLFQRRLAGTLDNVTKVVYVSPLKALSNDIARNLEGPLVEIRRTMELMGYGDPIVTAALRTGDTTPGQRRTMIKHPPHILVTTPESLYLLLTSQSGREVLSSAETLIVDEIHALVGNRRGAHLALSMERLAALTEGRLQRIGLSATQNPMALVADFLVGSHHRDADNKADCSIVDEGHLRALDLAIEMPDSPLEAVMANEVWEEIYNRLAELIKDHHTTLIFANTRRLAERLTYHLRDRLGEDVVAAHHGSLALHIRHAAESRLKQGSLKALVATASLELGIDIGHVDLVCQLGSSKSIATLLQRVGRSGHFLGGVPKGRLFPLTRDELVECTALLRCVQAGRLDRIFFQECPLDVLSQQVVAAAACEDWNLDDLFELVRGAWIYRDLQRDEFDGVVGMLADGIDTRWGRRGAHIYLDGVNGRIKGRKGARLTALTSGGAIPDNADYNVVLQPEGTFIGTINEDFAVESIPGDIFQLGNSAWQILKVEMGTVRVQDAAGQPPTIPFWLGEAPARTAELSEAVSQLRAEVDERADDANALEAFFAGIEGLSKPAAEQLQAYLIAARRALGRLPTQQHLLMERFFDEAGGMHLVIHAPFGGRLNRAWGLSLRKRFCRSFNFELQAAATEDAIVLSLGPKHSFPIEDVYQFLNTKSVRDVLVQALLDAPMFQTRWRWNASRSLALPRFRGGRRVPPAFQRMQAEDLIAVVFPDQLACLENIAGEREIPDHPLVKQTIDDCLEEVMDTDGLIALLEKIEQGEVSCSGLDLPEPSPLTHEILSAKPYAFLDNAPLEERRTQAVHLRRNLATDLIRERGLLDEDAIVEVRRQAWPRAETPDEVHEALLLLGGMSPEELRLREPGWLVILSELEAQKRAGTFSFVTAHGGPLTMVITAERLPEWQAIWPKGEVHPQLEAPDRERRVVWERDAAQRELMRGRLEICGPTTAAQLAGWFGFSIADVEAALLALEAEGMMLRGRFDPQLGALDTEEMQWCDRRLLARIHYLTVNRLRARIKPVSAHVLMRFLFHWQRVDPDNHAMERSGLEAVIALLEGFEAAAGIWEDELLAARMKRYQRPTLDDLCLSGLVGWGRIRPASGGSGFAVSGPMRTSPISLFFRENTELWQGRDFTAGKLSGYAEAVHEVLSNKGAVFFDQIQRASGLLPTQVEMGLGELVALGLASADSFSGLRALLLPAAKKPKPRRRSLRPNIGYHLAGAGRWSLMKPETGESEDQGDGMVDDALAWEDASLEYRAGVLLRRYGVVFRKLLERESKAPPWRDLLRVYRRLEAVGEIRGGHFVAGFSGEQFALPEAVGALRSFRNKPAQEDTLVVNACDPLNLVGTIVPGNAIAQTANNRLLFRNGLPLAALQAGKFIRLATCEASDHELAAALRKQIPAPRRRPVGVLG